MELSDQMLSEKVKYYEFEGFRLDVAKRELISPEESFPLTEKTFEVLQYLLQNNVNIIRKSDFFKTVWDSTAVDETNLTQHIYRIRKLLGKREDDTEFIETISKLGYKFAAAVDTVYEEIDDDNTEESENRQTFDDRLLPFELFNDSKYALAENAEDADPVDGTRPLSTAQSGNRPPAFSSRVAPPIPELNLRRFFTFTRITIGLVIVALITFAALEMSSTFDNRLSVTVLPFRQIGDNQDQKLQLGVADSLITRIGHNERLAITPTNVISPLYSGNPSADTASIFEIGKKLDTDILIVGTIQRESNLVRVNMQFFHEKDKRQICTAAFDESFSNVFDLQDIIAKKTEEKLLKEIESHKEFSKRY